jgi:transcriptional regulator
VLAIFHGPSAYVSPSLYPTKRATGKVVPTWNYAVAHAHGRLRAIEDPGWLRALVERLTTRHERGRQVPWQLADAPADFVQAQLQAIVGLEIAVTRLVGKWKMSQNRGPADRAGVVAGLRLVGSAETDRVADLVEGGSSGRA